MTPRAKSVLGFGLLLFFSGILAYGGCIYLIEHTSERAHILIDQYVSETKRFEQIEEAKKAAAVVKEAQATLDSIGVNGFEGQARLLNQLEKSGEELGVDVEIKNPREELHAIVGEKDYFLLTVLAGGSWKGLFRYIALLESIPMDLSITKVSFSGLSTNKAGSAGAEQVKLTPGGWQAELDVRVLKFKQKPL